MKIGQRLVIRFTLVSALLTGAILLFIYTLTRGFVHSDFIERLTRQASLEVLHFATPHVKDVIPPGSFMLVNPQTSIFSLDGKLLHQTGDFEIPENWVQFLREEDFFNAELGDYTTVGRKHTVEGIDYFVFVSDKDLPGQHELDILQKTMVIGWGLSLVLSYIAGLFFASKAMQPVKRVVREVNHITKDNLGHRLGGIRNPGNPDELDELILTFNALLDRIESAFVAQKRFLQHASHELKTPLTAIMGEAELALAKERSAEEYTRTLDVVVSEAERLIRITQGLLTLSRLEEGFFREHTEAIDINQLFASAVQTLRIVYPHREIRIIGNVDPPFVTGNAQLLNIVFNNVLDNALKYSHREVVVTLERVNGEAVVQITDYGIGIPEDELGRVTAAMFRARNASHVSGAGLGLSLVKRVMDAHGGSFNIDSAPDRGTTCTLTFPV